jgi:hypothetical protein
MSTAATVTSGAAEDSSGKNSDAADSPLGLILGVVFGSLALCCLVAAVVYYWRYHESEAQPVDMVDLDFDHVVSETKQVDYVAEQSRRYSQAIAVVTGGENDYAKTPAASIGGENEYAKSPSASPPPSIIGGEHEYARSPSVVGGENTYARSPSFVTTGAYLH